MEEGWTNNLNDLNLKIETEGDIVILTIGEFYSLADYGFMLTVAYGSKRKPPEWQLLFNPDQLIIDFSKFKGFDQMNGEFITLREEYEKFKGKQLLLCGVNEKTETFFRQFFNEFYFNFKIIDTREKAIEYYQSQKDKK